jgi:hypothetical protein
LLSRNHATLVSWSLGASGRISAAASMGQRFGILQQTSSRRYASPCLRGRRGLVRACSREGRGVLSSQQSHQTSNLKTRRSRYLEHQSASRRAVHQSTSSQPPSFPPHLSLYSLTSTTLSSAACVLESGAHANKTPFLNDLFRHARAA